MNDIAQQERAQRAQILDLFVEERWRRVMRVNSKCAQPSLSDAREGCPPKRVARRRTSESFGRQATRCGHHSAAYSEAPPVDKHP